MSSKSKTYSGRTVLFVGKRSGALQAAQRLGLKVLLLSEKKPRQKEAAIVADYRSCHFADGKSDWVDLAQQLCRGREVAAVLALVERAVLPAGMIREGLHIPGLDVETALNCTNKASMKQAARRSGIACARFISSEAGATADELISTLGLPIVLKSQVGSGSRGTRILRHKQDIPKTLPPGTLAESFVHGTEMSVESFVHDGQVIFSNPTEYFQPLWANILPAQLERATLAKIEHFNRAVIRALNITRGMTHLELFLTDAGLVFGELAVRPPGGHIMELLEKAYGFDTWQAWLEIELGEKPNIQPASQQVSGVWVLHPGKGTVRSIAGLEAARNVAGVEIAFRLRVGDQVDERIGAGQEKGYIMATGSNRNEVAHRLTRAKELLQITMERANSKSQEPQTNLQQEEQDRKMDDRKIGL